MSPALLLLVAMPSAPAEVTDLKLPPGFTARLYADNPLAPDIYTMTIDDAGRVLVAGPGYVRVLVDDDNDGYADRAVDLIEGLKDGPMGLLAEGDSLFVVADGGLKRYRGYNGNDKLKEPETLLELKTSGEHHAHAVRRGPDGRLYLLCGNMAGVQKEMITDHRSPVKEPIAGALVRISLDFKSVEVVADGFRNPYSFDFNLDGEPFTYDSDNERCVGLPWYEPCRFYHIVPGGNYGWRSPQLSQMWRKPAYFPDVVPPICYLGRGSPTGVACYRHTHFPEKYRGGIFLADWTFGRIHHVPLKPSGSTYGGNPEVFIEATGTSGFAPTALAVHPKTGELFISIGGRGTRGGVYRITFAKSDANSKPLPMAKRSLDYDKAAEKQWLKDCAAENPLARRQALEQIWRHRDKGFDPNAVADAVKPNLAHRDPLVRAAGARVAVAFAVPTATANTPQARLSLALASVKSDPDWAEEVAIDVLSGFDSAELKLQAARIIQLVYGDLTATNAIGSVWEGYTLRNIQMRKPTAKLLKVLRSSLRLNDENLDREVARTLAALGGAKQMVTALATQLTIVSRARDDLHYLAILARIEEQEWTVTDSRLVVRALLRLQEKSLKDGDTHDRHWPLRVTEVVEALGRNCPGLSEAILNHPDFGRPEHVAFIKPLEIPHDKAARKFLAFAATEPGFTWTPELVLLLGELPQDVSRAIMERLLQKQPELEDAILAVLARDPVAGDANKFLAGLDSFNPQTVRLCAATLARLRLVKSDPQVEVVRAIKALRRLAPEEKAARTEVAGLLQQWTGAKIDADAKAWSEWLAKNRSDLLRFLDATDGFDSAKWQKQLAGINWAKGDAARGRAVFTKASCAACHDGGRALGPPLVGVTKRFSRDDLLTAILQPNKDVPARYRATRITTTDEKSYTGILVYEATSGVILQTGIDTSVRIAGEDIVSKKQVDVSLMPAGLLDKLTDAEIADLLAYLATLTEPKPK